MDEDRDWIALLGRRAAAITDPAMRVAYVRSEIAERQPEDIVDLVAIAGALTESRIAPHPELMLAVSLALADESMRELRGAAHDVALTRSLVEVSLVLLGGPDDRSTKDRSVPDFGRGRPLTLGERKAIARKNDRDLIARVLRDPHPDVIRILLGNPSVTETDIVRLCARRPISTEVIREVFRSTRWIVRYHVRRAIVLNPYAPLDVTLSLVHHLTAQDRRLLAGVAEIAEELRRVCRAPAVRDYLH